MSTTNRVTVKWSFSVAFSSVLEDFVEQYLKKKRVANYCPYELLTCPDLIPVSIIVKLICSH